jgi:hypothetical protein
MTPESNGGFERRVGKLEDRMERVFTDLYHETGGLVGNFRDLVTVLKEREAREKEQKKEVVDTKKVRISQNAVIIGLLSLILGGILTVVGWIISAKINHSSVSIGKSGEYSAHNSVQNAEK